MIVFLFLFCFSIKFINSSSYDLDEIDDSDKWEIWSYVLGRQMGDQWNQRYVRGRPNVDLVCQGLQHGSVVNFDQEQLLHPKDSFDVSLKQLEKPPEPVEPEPAESTEEPAPPPPPPPPPPPAVTDDLIASASYGYGWLVGDSFNAKNRGWNLRKDVVCAGLTSALAQAPSLLTAAQFDRTVEEMREDYKQHVFKNKLRQSYEKSENWMKARIEQEQAADAEKGVPEADRLVVDPDRQFFYRVLHREQAAEGAGKLPQADHVVTLHVMAENRIGEKFFDSTTSDDGQPRRYLMSTMLPCWNRVLSRVQPGTRVKLVCHPSLAYGDRGFGKQVRPGELAIFQLALLHTEPASAADIEELSTLDHRTTTAPPAEAAPNTGAKVLIKPKTGASDSQANDEQNKKTEL